MNEELKEMLAVEAGRLKFLVDAGEASRPDYLVLQACSNLLQAVGVTAPGVPGSTMTPKDTIPEVHAIITCGEEVKGAFGGPNAALAKHLNLVAATDAPVLKVANPTLAMGQDIFLVDRDYFMSIRGMFPNPGWSEIRALVIPETARISLIVSY